MDNKYLKVVFKNHTVNINDFIDLEENKTPIFLRYIYYYEHAKQTLNLTENEYKNIVEIQIKTHLRKKPLIRYEYRDYDDNKNLYLNLYNLFRI